MARKVKCQVTGEYGTSDTFVKIDGRYYKSVEVYEADRKKKQDRLDLIDYVCCEFLDYKEGQPFSSFLPRKLQELAYYDDSLILQVFKDQAQIIRDSFNRISFPNELNKISYMIGIVRNALPDALKKREREACQERLAASRTRIEEKPVVMQSPVERKTNDISCWLEEDEL